MKYSDLLEFPSRQDVVRLAAQAFKEHDGEMIMEILDSYGQNSNEPHREFIQMALIFYARGDAERLRQMLDQAKSNYHDWLFGQAFEYAGLNQEIDLSPPTPLLPLSSPVTKERAAQLLKVHWKQIDVWVNEGKLRSIPQSCLFTIEELEHFQRSNKPEIDIEELWHISSS